MPRPAVDAVGRHHRTPRHWSLGQTAHEKWIFLRRGPRRAVSPVMRPGPAGRSPECPACRAEEHRVVVEGAFLAIGMDVHRPSRGRRNGSDVVGRRRRLGACLCG